MTTIDKRIEKFYKKPIPNDITYSEMRAVAEYYGCIVENSGRSKHSLHVIYPPLGISIPIPVHGKTVKEAYIKELKKLFEKIKEGEGYEI